MYPPINVFKKKLKNIRTWANKLNIIINIIQFINIIKIKINIITIEKNIDLILRVKSIIIVIIIIIIINLGHASLSEPKKLGTGKGCLTQVAWV
jgi:hypothetical protein